MSSLWYDATTEAAVNAVTALLNGSSPFGRIEIYSGTQPALNGSLTGSGQVLLATLAFSATAFAAATAASGTVTATATTITSGTAAATGTAGWFALVTSGGTTVATGTVGTSGADLNLSSLSITSGATVSCSAFAITMTGS